MKQLIQNKISLVFLGLLTIFGAGFMGVNQADAAITVNVMSSVANPIPSNTSTDISWTSSGWSTPTNVTCTSVIGGVSRTTAGATGGPYSTGSITVNTNYAVNCSNPTGSISASPCEISAGASTCSALVTWSTQDLTANPTEVTRNNPDFTHVSWATSGTNIGNTVNYGSSTYYLYHNEYPIAQNTINIGCTAGSTWDTGQAKCILDAVSSPSGNISTTSCEIDIDASTCNARVMWSTANLTASPTEVTRNNPDFTHVSFATSMSSPGLSNTVNYGTSTYYLYHSDDILDQNTINVDCVSGGVWSVAQGKCVAIITTLDVNFIVTPLSVSSGGEVSITWSSPDATSCVGTEFNTNNSNSGNVLVYPIETTTYEITCSNATSYSTRQQTVTVNGVKKKPKFKEE